MFLVIYISQAAQSHMLTQSFLVISALSRMIIGKSDLNYDTSQKLNQVTKVILVWFFSKATSFFWRLFSLRIHFGNLPQPVRGPCFPVEILTKIPRILGQKSTNLPPTQRWRKCGLGPPFKEVLFVEQGPCRGHLQWSAKEGRQFWGLRVGEVPKDPLDMHGSVGKCCKFRFHNF